MNDLSLTPATELEQAAQVLESSADYRVLRRLVPRDDFGVRPGGTLLKAAIVDTETTGTDPATDRIIELCVLVFEYSADTGEVAWISDVYDGLEDPRVAIPPQSTLIHGITDEMVSGEAIDDEAVEGLLDGVNWVIAHNAGFDRPLLERRLPIFARLNWLCSMKEVPWSDLGFPGTKLEYLATERGFFYEGHRSEIDCRALLEVLRVPLPGKDHSPWQLLLAAGPRRSYKLWALGAPFETKDQLKERGYRWDGERRTWYKMLDHDEAAAEAQWLRETIYAGRSHKVEVEVLEAATRYSARRGRIAYRDL
jgi:DNA polymerase-3 subunit epsilon